VREALRRQGIMLTDPSAYVQLRYFHELPNISGETQKIIGHFLMRVTTDGNLPVEVDLINEALWLVRELFPDSSPPQLTS
jgi:hypothetical protein